MNPKTRKLVLMTADTVGGVWTYALALAGAMETHGIHFILASMGDELNMQQRQEIARHTNVELRESRYKLEWMEDPWEDVAAAGEWLLKLEAEFKPDLVHLNGYTHAALPWTAPKLVVGHSCVLSWWRAVHGTEAPETWNRYREHVRTGLRAANLVVAPSQAMLTSLEQDYGPFRSSQVIHNGRAIPPSVSGKKKRNFVLAAGRIWDKAKNITSLAEVALELEWPVFVAGAGTVGAAHRLEGDGLQLLGRIGVDELWHWYAEASIYALPALYEPFGLSVLEAGLAGCGLVLGDIPSLRELWDGAACFVPPNDREALKHALASLINNPDLRSAFAARSQARASGFTLERMAWAYLEAYAGISSADWPRCAGLDTDQVRRAAATQLAA